MNNKLRVLDLFSGIGGFSLGLHSTGIFDTVKFVEIDKFCQKVLNKNFSDIPIEEDIRNVKGQEFEADVITGGFPCQPFSVAGKQKGTNDNRYLWPEMFRLIKEIKPEFVIGENVQGLINLQNGMVLRQVQDDLESEGFEVQCFLIPASGIGAWHQRNRVWMIGHSKHNGLLASEKRSRDKKINGWTQEGQNQTIKSERASGSRDNEDVSNTNTRLSIGENEEIQARGNSIACSSKNVSNTISSLRGGGRAIGQSGENKVWRFRTEEEKQTRLDIRSETIGRDAVSGEEEVILQSNNERQQESNTSKESEGQTLSSGGHVADETKQTWWQVASAVRGIPNGISYELDKARANRIKTLGNAIVPQIARELGLAIKKVMNEDTNI